MGNNLKVEGDVRQVEYRGDSIRYRVGVPLAQSVLAGLSVVIGGCALILCAMYPDALGIWWLPVLGGVGLMCYLLGWRGWKDVRAPYAQERDTGEDLNHDTYIGDPRTHATNASVDENVVKMLERMYTGRSTSKADMVGAGKGKMSYDNWVLVRNRLSNRGIAEQADKRGGLAPRPEYKTFAAAWKRYVESERRPHWMMNQDDETVDAE